MKVTIRTVIDDDFDLKDAMNKANISGSELAKRTGISPFSISKAATGRAPVTEAIARKLKETVAQIAVERLTSLQSIAHN